MDTLSLIISEIKKKKELQTLNDDFVKTELLKIIKQEPKFNIVLEKFNPKSALLKELIKKTREKLRRTSGLFKKEKKITAEEITKIDFNELLKIHSSTRERISFYDKLYSDLFKTTGKPLRILDLGCGMNPLSIPLMKLEKLEYYAYDIIEEVNLLNLFFAKLHQKNHYFYGEAGILNLLELERVRQLPKADIAFLFKVTDVLDRNKGHKNTEAVLQAIPAKYLIVSFPTLTMSGKKMTAPRRRWMEWLCNRLGREYQVLEYVNELFYVVRKN